MAAKMLLYILIVPMCLACSLQRHQSKQSHSPKSIAIHSLKEIHGQEEVSYTAQGLVQWTEGQDSYQANLSYLTHRYMFPKLRVQSGAEALRKQGDKWLTYMNARLGAIGIRIEKLLLSIPGHMLIARVFTDLNRVRTIDCLLHPNATKRGFGVVYTKPELFTSENMAIRELYEDAKANQILIVDHLRDRNQEGDLCVVYILQDVSDSSDKKQKRQGYWGGHVDHRNLFTQRSLTYQYICDILSPITVSLQNSCRYKTFIPRDSTEQISPTFLSNPQ